MKSLRLVPGLVLLGFLAAGSAQAQFVRMARCHAAYPCLVPFSIQYSPDPLIAGPYAQPGYTAISGRFELKAPLKVEIDRPIDQKAIDEAVRKTIEIRPPGKKPAAPPPAVESPNPKLSPPGS